MKKNIFGIAAACALIAAFAVLVIVKRAGVPQGFNDIKKARGRYESLDSARLTMTDLATGETLMTFCFYINGNNEMILDYDSPRNGEHAYSDGKQFYYRAEDKWTAITPADEEYIHNIFNRKYRYPYARGTVFFLDGTAVSEAHVTEENGGKTVTYIYDADKLNAGSARELDNVSEFSELTCTYTINESGLITKFAQKGSLVDADGKLSEVNILLEVSDVNNVKVISAPFD